MKTKEAMGSVSLLSVRDAAPLMTVEEAAGLVGLSRSSAYRAVEAGELPSIRLGRRLFIPTASLFELLGLFKAEEGPSKSRVRTREEWPWLA